MKEDTIRLVKKAIKGSKAAYGELIAQYQVYLYKTAFLYVKNEADSLDAVQECVTRGLLGIEKLKEPKYFKTWITRILLNCIWQDQKRTQTVSLDEYREKGVENYLIEEKVDLYDAIDSLKEQYKTVTNGAGTIIVQGGTSLCGSLSSGSVRPRASSNASIVTSRRPARPPR